jgi:hypothetical protein
MCQKIFRKRNKEEAYAKAADSVRCPPPETRVSQYLLRQSFCFIEAVFRTKPNKTYLTPALGEILENPFSQRPIIRILPPVPHCTALRDTFYNRAETILLTEWRNHDKGAE